MGNFWENQDTISNYEMLGDNSQPEVISITPFHNISHQVVEEIQEESAFELDEQETSIVYNARLRLEQARLYEMLINHNLFEGVSADQQAIQNVQNELKEYIVYRLEVLLGLRALKPQATEIQSQFNEIEVDFLKQLAYKGTRGVSIQATQQPSDIKPVQTTPVVNKLKSLSNIPTKPTIQPIEVKPTIKPAAKTTTKLTKTVNKKPTNSVRQKIKADGLGERRLTPQEAEAIAREDLKISQNRKKLSEMTPKEKAQEILRVNERHAKIEPTNKVPLMTPEQIEFHYMKQQQTQSSGGSDLNQFNLQLANKLAAIKQREG
ncbi:MAG TPA: hypothetical protein VI911_11635 [Patescibacteria group bacterium]|nr:hypothetical protein [Patescibacteria group bacterium]